MRAVPNSGDDIEQTVLTWLSNVARFFMIFGLIALAIGVAALVFAFVTFSQGANASEAQGMNNVRFFGPLALGGSLVAGLGAAYYFWGEETSGPIILLLGGALWTAPFYLPSMIPNGQGSEVAGQALLRIQSAGLPMAIIGILAILVDVFQRAQLRAREGARADAIKYGRNMKEERDTRNVFLGKCWQLPYCRKFVREVCPIYHSRRTCWRERVGCMCEEQLIKNAMARGNEAIPRDIVAAEKMIPRNSRLTDRQKAERCRQCVIYNEHEKHKYKLMTATLMVTVFGFYAAFRGPLLTGVSNLLLQMDSGLNRVTYSQGQGGQLSRAAQVPVFQEILLAVGVFIVLAYGFKLIEYLCFKLRI